MKISRDKINSLTFILFKKIKINCLSKALSLNPNQVVILV